MFLSLIIVAGVVFLIVLLIRFFVYIAEIKQEKREKKETTFVLENSIALKCLAEINKKYSFFECNNYDEEHVYDNEKFYNDISCQDYLTYQLQFKKKGIAQAIRNVKYNKEDYEEYIKEVENISLGQFSTGNTEFKLQRLTEIEKELFDAKKLKPVISFDIKITLCCSLINGRIYRTKMQNFDSRQVLSIIQRLANKNGDFYNDEEIWNSISKVERGRVSNKMRFAIYERDGYKCQICGKSGSSVDLEIDHIKPIAKGGKSVYENLQTLCSKCNKEKGAKY